MGSRAVVVVCRDAASARALRRRRARGAIYTRTGRPFFDDARGAALGAPGARIRAAGLWDGWARTGRARLRAAAVVGQGDGADPQPVRRRRRRGEAGLGAAVGRARRRPPRAGSTSARCSTATRAAQRASSATATPTAVLLARRRLDDLRLAPFHVLAAEGGVFADRDHRWHLERCDRSSPRTRTGSAHRAPRRRPRRPGERGRGHRVVGGDDRAPAARGWSSSPRLHRAGRRGLVQPGIKCRGREYLRIIYGPEYDAPAKIDRLRSRGARPQALPRLARVRARHRGARALRPPRAAATGSTNASSPSSRWRAKPVDPRLYLRDVTDAFTACCRVCAA